MAARKVRELPEAVIAAQAITRANDAIDAPVPILLGELNVLRRRYRWIKRFIARRLSVGLYSIRLIASDHEIGEYRTRLKRTGTNTWESSGGLVYGPDLNFPNRVQHVLAHTVPNSLKKAHTVFSVPRNKLLSLIDEAWLRRRIYSVSGPYWKYEIDMMRKIGTAGETRIRILVRPGTSEIISSYPIL